MGIEGVMATGQKITRGPGQSLRQKHSHSQRQGAKMEGRLRCIRGVPWARSRLNFCGVLCLSVQEGFTALGRLVSKFPRLQVGQGCPDNRIPPPPPPPGQDLAGSFKNITNPSMHPPATPFPSPGGSYVMTALHDSFCLTARGVTHGRRSGLALPLSPDT